MRRIGPPEAIEALKERLAVQRRMQMQLSRFHDEMERLVTGLDTITASVSSTSDRDELIDEITCLRDEMSSVATGMSYAF